MVLPAPKPGGFFPAELLRLLGTAQRVTGRHVNRRGRCASRWPCRQVELAESTLAAL